MDMQQTHEPTRFLFLRVMFTCEGDMIQGIPIGTKVFLGQWITAQQDKTFKTKQLLARCPMCPCLPPTTSDPFYIEMATATAQTWRKKLSLFRKDTAETRTIGLWVFFIPCYLQGFFFFP